LIDCCGDFCYKIDLSDPCCEAVCLDRVAGGSVCPPRQHLFVAFARVWCGQGDRGAPVPSGRNRGLLRTRPSTLLRWGGVSGVGLAFNIRCLCVVRFGGCLYRFVWAGCEFRGRGIRGGVWRLAVGRLGRCAWGVFGSGVRLGGGALFVSAGPPYPRPTFFRGNDRVANPPGRPSGECGRRIGDCALSGWARQASGQRNIVLGLGARVELGPAFTVVRNGRCSLSRSGLMIYRLSVTRVRVECCAA